MNPKIFHLNNLTIPARENKKIIHCHGCYDLFHYGHLSHLQEAKTYGDILVVTITADEYVGKGDGRPIIPTYQRTAIIAGLECVDYVAISNYPTASHAIYTIRADIYVKGVDYVGHGIVQEEKDAIDAIGAKLLFTQTDKMSTSEIIEKCKRV